MLTAVLVLSGCADPVVFSEVFQLNKDQRLYTAYNLWYTDPLRMDTRNIQEGAFIPVGTEIEPVSTGRWSNEIIFKVPATGKTYCIKYSPAWRLCSMREFISYTFTTRNQQELLQGIAPAVQTRILRGEVVPGMNHQAVLLAYGPPPAARTPDRRNDTWIYWRTPAENIRLIFRNDLVRSIITPEQR